MAKVGYENLQCDTGEYGQSTCAQKYQVQGKRVRWAAPFMLRLPGIIEVTAATSVEQPEFLVKEQRVWKDRVIPGPVEVSPLNPIRTNPINMECVDRAVSFEEHPKLPVAPYARAARPEPMPVVSKDRYPAPGPVFVRESYEFRDLERDFERRGPRGRVTYFDFEDVVRSKTSRLSASRLRKAFDRMKIPNTDYIFYDEFLNLVGRNRTSARADLIERFIVDAVLDLNV